MSWFGRAEAKRRRSFSGEEEKVPSNAMRRAFEKRNERRMGQDNKKKLQA